MGGGGISKLFRRKVCCLLVLKLDFFYTFVKITINDYNTMKTRINKTSYLIAASIPSLLSATLTAGNNVSKTPNVVYIIADDLGYGDLSCYGQEKFNTPNIDKLAQEGKRFTQCYSGTTVSAPSRASLITGLHTGHTPIRGNKELMPEGQFALPANIPSLISVFKNAGYVTGAFGKWGLGSPGSTGDPNNQGIDDFFGFNCQLLAHNYYADHLWENDKRIALPENDNGAFGTYTQDLIHDKALDFIHKNKDENFFLFLPYILPHAELIVPEDSIIQKFRGMYPEKPYKGVDAGSTFRKGGYCSQTHPRATFAAMVYRLDVYVGQVVAKLKEEGLYDNTMIVFCSDNGPHQEGGADPEFFNGNGIYRGYKRDLYEGGIRVPFIASWPGKIEAGTESDLMCSFWDMMPTFSDILKVKVPAGDGVTILPTLIGKGRQKQHDYLYFEFQEAGGRQAVRQGNWKLIRLNVRKGANSIYELYNLAADPQEKYNVASAHPKQLEKLTQLMLSAHCEDENWPLY